MVDDTTQQQAGLVRRLKEQHAAESERAQRRVLLRANARQMPMHLAAASAACEDDAVAVAPGSACKQIAPPWTAELTLQAFALQAASGGA